MLGDQTMKNLRTYRLMKHDFGLELYLEEIRDKSIRKCVSSFRISTHRLRIELGRFLGEKPEDKLFNACNTHVIPLKMKCTFYVNVKSMKVRGKYFMII